MRATVIWPRSWRVSNESSPSPERMKKECLHLLQVVFDHFCKDATVANKVSINCMINSMDVVDIIYCLLEFWESYVDLFKYLIGETTSSRTATIMHAIMCLYPILGPVHWYHSSWNKGTTYTRWLICVLEAVIYSFARQLVDQYVDTSIIAATASRWPSREYLY